ncbi:MAG: hypothetical protein JSW07_07615 [bacterium]|nr:MAG: hypothetical protein JSW07_07615 [bacterium]
MRIARKYIEIVQKRGEKGLPLKRVYKNILNQELFLMAYGNIYANAGAMTQGIDATDTVDGMSLKLIDRIIKKLRRRKYQWKPARRIQIPKPNSNKKRPLGIPVWSDKLTAEVIRIVLSAYYEPQFCKYSHGFRHLRGCHTALQEIGFWTGTKWFIEGDIRGCFDNIDHDTLLKIIGKKIKDRSLLKLIKEMLKAGYMEDWKYHDTYSGVPQGGVLSPLLSNILLSELDCYVANELIPQYTRGKARQRNPEYNRLNVAMTYAKQKGKIEKYNELCERKRKIPCQLTDDPNYRRLRYVRYADDFLLGFIGTRSEAVEIKRKISEFLKRLKLAMSEEKTLITHAKTGKAKFLGYEIYIAHDDKRYTKNHHRLNKPRRRSINGCPIFSIPTKVIIEWNCHFTKKVKTVHRTSLLRCSDFEIVRTFGVEFQGLANYYSMAHNASKLYRVKHHYMTALAKTIAAKHKKNIRWVYRKYKRKSEYGVTGLFVEKQNPNNPNKPLVAKFGYKPLRRNKSAIIIDDKPQAYKCRMELITRLLANKCELCGSDQDIQGHHVRKLKDVNKKYQGRKRKHPPTWIEFMIKRNRKVVFVCLKCHIEIHNGKYDGCKVELRLTGEPYDTETVTYGSERASWKSASVNIAA